MAGAGAGADDADEWRRGQSHRLSRHRWMVRHLRGCARHVVAAVLGRAGGGSGGGDGLFSDLSRPGRPAEQALIFGFASPMFSLESRGAGGYMLFPDK